LKQAGAARNLDSYRRGSLALPGTASYQAKSATRQ
jgi:hypothetical protein